MFFCGFGLYDVVRVVVGFEVEDFIVDFGVVCLCCFEFFEDEYCVVVV